MASTMERRNQSSRRSGHTRSRSPARDRVSSPRKLSPSARRERSHAEKSVSPRRQSPIKASRSHRESSPQREMVKERVRSVKHTRALSRSPSPDRKRESRSLSPRSKRLRRAQHEQDESEVIDSDRPKPPNREERSTRKQMERDEGRNASRDRKGDGRMNNSDGRDHSHSRDRRSDKDDRSGASREARSGRDDERHDSRGKRTDPYDRKGASREQRTDQDDRRDSARQRMADRHENNAGSGKSSRHGRSVSPEERHRGRHESRSSPRTSRNAAGPEVCGDTQPFSLYLSIILICYLALSSFIACMFLGAAQYPICSTQMSRMSENHFIPWNINWTLCNLCSQ